MTGWSSLTQPQSYRHSPTDLVRVTHWAEQKHLMWAGVDPLLVLSSTLSDLWKMLSSSSIVACCIKKDLVHYSLCCREKTHHPSPPGTPAKLREKGNKRMKWFSLLQVSLNVPLLPSSLSPTYILELYMKRTGSQQPSQSILRLFEQAPEKQRPLIAWAQWKKKVWKRSNLQLRTYFSKRGSILKIEGFLPRTLLSSPYKEGSTSSIPGVWVFPLMTPAPHCLAPDLGSQAQVTPTVTGVHKRSSGRLVLYQRSPTPNIPSALKITCLHLTAVLPHQLGSLQPNDPGWQHL